MVGVTGAPEAPTIDIVIPILNEHASIGRCLDQVLNQDYPADLVRVVVIDNGSTDGTVEIAQNRAMTDHRLLVVADAVRRTVPEALNLAVDYGTGELIARVDAHGYPERDFLRSAVAVLASAGPDVACVGGRAIQHGQSPFGQAAAMARSSRFGVGASHYAGAAQREYVDHVGWGIYRRKALLAVDGFDPSMVAGEDEEINWRLRRAGGRILLDSSIRFHYFGRDTFCSSFRQYQHYGRARVRVIRKHPEFLRPHHCVPAVFVGTLISLALASLVSRQARRILGRFLTGYLLTVATASVISSRRRLRRTPAVACAFASLHLGYGVGSLQEIVSRPPLDARRGLREAVGTPRMLT